MSQQLPEWALPEQPLPFPESPLRRSFFGGKIGPIPFWAIVLTLIVIVAVGESISWSMLSRSPIVAVRNTRTSASTAVDTPIPELIATHRFTGYGVGRTEVFHVADKWQIVWSCNPASFYGQRYDLVVSVNNANGKTLDFAAVNVTCGVGYTTDVKEEHSGGDIYLDVTSQGAWTIQVQDLG